MTNTPNPRQQDDSLSSSAPGQQTGDETIEVRPPRDHEAAQIALAEVQQWLQRLDLIRDMGHSDRTDDRSVIVERVNEQQLLSHLQARLKKLHPADVGYILEALPTDERGQLWGLIGADRDAEVLLEVSDSVREFLISITPLDEMVEMSRTMNADDLAELAECLPDDIVTLVQEQLTEKERQQLRAALSSDEDSVGAHMDFDLVTIREDVTVETVFRYLRRFESLPPHTDSVFVVDRDDMLKGVLPTDRLLVAEPEKLVSQVMLADSLTFDAPDNIFEAAQAFERYDLVSA
ncbi:MAG: CBS domain-containing protein, partial [Burkholderiaceae bacterium]